MKHPEASFSLLSFYQTAPLFAIKYTKPLKIFDIFFNASILPTQPPLTRDVPFRPQQTPCSLCGPPLPLLCPVVIQALFPSLPYAYHPLYLYTCLLRSVFKILDIYLPYYRPREFGGKYYLLGNSCLYSVSAHVLLYGFRRFFRSEVSVHETNICVNCL